MGGSGYLLGFYVRQLTADPAVTIEPVRPSMVDKVIGCIQLLEWLSGKGLPIPAFVVKAFYSFGLRFSGLALQFIGSIVIARTMGVEAFGAYATAFSWAIIVGAVLPLGLDHLAVREVPRYLVEQRNRFAHGYTMALIGTILINGIFALLFFAVADVTGMIELETGWILGGIMALVHAGTLGLAALMASVKKVVLSQLLEVSLRQCIYLGSIIFIAWLGFQITPAGLFVISIIGAIPVIVLMIWHVHKSLFKDHPKQQPLFRIRMWYAAALPLLVMNLANLLQNEAGLLMVSEMLGDTEAGLYRAAARGAALVLIVDAVIARLLAPMLSHSLAANDQPEVRRLLRLSALLSIGVGASICLVLGGGANFYLGLFGEEFTAGRSVLWIFLAGYAVYFMTGAATTLLIMLGHEKSVLLVKLVTLALCLILNFILIPKYGIVGGALGTMIAFCLDKIILLWIVLAATHYNPTIFQFGK